MSGPLNNGHLLDATGARAPIVGAWQYPAGQSPYFGWMGDDGFTTIRIDHIRAVVPHPQMRGRHVVWLEGNLNLIINNEDAERLLKRMGWTEPKR